MDAGAIGSYLGPIIGVLGGAFGTYCSVKNTEAPAERQFMVQFAVAVWVGVLLLAGLPLVLWRLGAIPGWSYWLSFGLFFVLLAPGIFYANKRQAQLRGRIHS